MSREKIIVSPTDTNVKNACSIVRFKKKKNVFPFFFFPWIPLPNPSK